MQEDGTRNIYFELNGEPRQVSVNDLSVESEDSSHIKADPDDSKQVGAPMPGKIFKLLVAVGDEVKEGDTLISTEAMKMETAVKSKRDGVVKEIMFKEEDLIDQGDLLVIID